MKKIVLACAIIVLSLVSIRAIAQNDTTQNNFKDPLIQAAAKDNLELVNELIQKKHPLNKEEDGVTALIIAIQKKNKKIIDALIKAGANVNQHIVTTSPGTTEGNWTTRVTTPLGAAYGTNDKDIIQKLLDAGARTPPRYGINPPRLPGQRMPKKPKKKPVMPKEPVLL